MCAQYLGRYEALASRRPRVALRTELVEPAAIEEPWRELWQRVPNATAFQRPDWCLPWCEHLLGGDAHVLAVWRGSTLSAVATGAANNLIHRAAEVHLKERRKLILVPREAPLSLAHIDNMRRVTEAGGIILPASPGFYHGAGSIDDLVNFVVARICDQLAVEHTPTKRWGTE